MALTLKDSICWGANGKYFYIYDTTGTYSALNLGGYGSPNPAIANVATATLSIWNPSTTTNLPDTTGTVSSAINLYPTLPNIVETPFTVTNALAGFGTGTFDDGIYYMTYTVTGTLSAVDFTYSVSCYQLNYHNIRCCLDQWNARVLACGCDKNSQDYQRYMLAELKFQAMLNEECCTHINKAAEFLTQLQKMCPRDCGCGN